MLIDTLVHPILALLVTAVLEISVMLHEINIFIHHVPNLLDASAIESAVA